MRSPADLRLLKDEELKALAEEIRETIIKTVGTNGGHLASNLGIVETVIAVHRVFDTPKDALIFDVGHQCYAHKILTGRYEKFGTLRRDGGISGFVNAEESDYDVFTEGHSGASLSQALGLSASSELTSDEKRVIAIVGDGSFTNGMIFEALNNCVAGGKKLTIILNDNEMSISKNVGGLSEHLTNIRTSKKYFAIKHGIKKNFAKIPLIGSSLQNFMRKIRDFIKRVLVSYNLFECLGVDYIGLVDGNDITKIETVLEEAKTKSVCTLVHIHTQKGKGYAPAERNPEKYHSVSPFDISLGVEESRGKTFSSVFGETLRALAEKNEKICAVTAAMEEGCGLLPFKEQFPDRFFDVGIAEEHAVTFSAGLSRGGLSPVCVMYSTFSQRVYDQLHHDAAVQKIPFVLCLDRAGVVEGDGVTHQGIFDVSEFAGIPGVRIYSPETFGELEGALTYAAGDAGLSIIRYPKGAEGAYDRSLFCRRGGYCVMKTAPGKCAASVVTYGRITKNVYEAAMSFSKKTGIAVKLIKLVKIFPLEESLAGELSECGKMFFVEEGIKSGGAGEKAAAFAAERLGGVKVRIRAIEGFVPHGALESLFSDLGLSADKIEKELYDFVCGGE